MAEEVKFTKEEMDRIQGIQKDYIGVQGELGQLSISRLRLETQMNSLDNREDELKNKFGSLQESERNFISEINSKYGECVLDPETGTFIPSQKK